MKCDQFNRIVSVQTLSDLFHLQWQRDRRNSFPRKRNKLGLLMTGTEVTYKYLTMYFLSFNISKKKCLKKVCHTPLRRQKESIILNKSKQTKMKLFGKIQQCSDN